MRRAPRASNGPDHLGLCALQVLIYGVVLVVYLVFQYYVVYPIGGVGGGHFLRGFSIGHIGGMVGVLVVGRAVALALVALVVVGVVGVVVAVALVLVVVVVIVVAVVICVPIAVSR